MYSLLFLPFALATTVLALPTPFARPVPEFGRLAELMSENHCSADPTLFLSDGNHPFLTYIEPSYSTTFFDDLISSEASRPVSLASDDFFPNLSEHVKVMPWVKSVFEETAEALLDEVKQELTLSKETNRIELVGHGIGGSVALLHALHLETSLNDPSIVIEVTLFGSPRTGNQAFVDYTSAHLSTGSNHVNFVSSPTDPVPHFPPRGTSKSGYRDPPSTQSWDIASDGRVTVKGESLSIQKFLTSNHRENLSGMQLDSHWETIEGVKFEKCLA